MANRVSFKIFPKGVIFIPKKLTTEEYRERIKTLFPNISLIGEYNGARVETKFQCNICGHVWDVQPDSLKQTKHGCPKCAHKYIGDKQKICHEDFIQKVYKINPNIIVLERYVNSRHKLLCQCKIDNYQWYASPDKLLQGKGCPVCRGSKPLTHDEFLNRMLNINPNIQIIGKYINDSTKILLECKICHHRWEADPSHLYRGTGCPYCNMSKGEKRILNWLESNNITSQIEYKFDDCKNINALPFDFYLPELNICIEYDGEYHYQILRNLTNSSFEKRLKCDEIKNNYCKEHNIKLIRIPYWKFNNIENILKETLL